MPRNGSQLVRLSFQPMLKDGGKTIDYVGITSSGLALDVVDGGLNVEAERTRPHEHQVLLIIEGILTKQRLGLHHALAKEMLARRTLIQRVVNIDVLALRECH